MYQPASKKRKRSDSKGKGPAPSSSSSSTRYSKIAPSSAELKFLDTSFVDAVVANTASIVEDSICPIVQGYDEDERIGRKVMLKSVTFRYQMTLPEVNQAATPSSGDHLRVILYQDKQTNGAAATASLILESTTNFQSFYNLTDRARFNILYDKTHTLNYMTLTSDAVTKFDQAGRTAAFGTYVKCNVPLEFSGVTGGLSELRTNNIGILLCSNTGVCGFVGNCRIRYTDN